MLHDGSDDSSFLYFQRFFFLSRLFFFDDESGNDGSGSGSSGTCAYPFCFGNSVGHVSGVGSGISPPTGIESIDDGEMVKCVFVPTGIESIGDVVPLVIEIFSHSKS